jgi:hypothetical protein
LQEQVTDKTVALIIKGGKVSAKVLAKALRALVRKMQNPKEKPGQQSIRKLTKQGAKLQSIEIGDGNIKSFEHTARKYGLSFSLKKDIASEEPRYIVFFKGRDEDVMTAAFNEYAARTLRQKDKPSIMERLPKWREMVKGIAAPVKHRNRGGIEL